MEKMFKKANVRLIEIKENFPFRLVEYVIQFNFLMLNKKKIKLHLLLERKMRKDGWAAPYSLF